MRCSMSVKLELYKVFKEVAEAGNITAAASALFISQSAVSQSIKQLEAELQTRLFARNSRGVTLTPDGKMLYEYVRSAIGLLETGEEKLSQSRHLQMGHLTIGASDTVTSQFLLPFLDSFHRQYPAIHSYFNLDGDPSTDNSAYLLTLNADSYTPVDSTFMTTGEIVTVEGTPMDFRKPTAIGANINQDFEQLKNGNGIDHNWVLNTQGDVNKVCATLESPTTGIVLDVYTNEPGIQVYCGNFLDGTLTGKKGIVYNFRASVCLETQKYPDTPNKPEWASAVLRPGEKYHSECIYKFSVRK